MAYITPLYGGSDAQIDYRLGLGHGCGADHDLSYRTDARERPLRWIGEGLEAFGVPEVHAGAELTSEQFEMARRLIAGQHIGSGEQLVEPKVGVVPAAKVAVEPLVAAVRQRATRAGVAPEELFTGPAARQWAAAVRTVNRRGGAAVTRVDDAVRLAEAAGLDPHAVWSEDTITSAVAALTHAEAVLDADGEVVRDEDGTPQIRMVPHRQRIGIAGYDIGITVPKSMSVLLAFAPDELTERVERTYSDAVNRTFSWTESRTSYVKRGKHGNGKSARQEQSRGFSGWVMVHRAARPVAGAPIGDPHWHVHITIGNLAQAVHDGKWLTVAAGGRELMRHAAAIDKVTQATIRATLYHELGIRFARSERTALWEVEHIPAATLELFSKRSHQVTEVLTALGYDPTTVSGKERRILTRRSRSGKTEATAESDVTLREYWRAQALAAGQDPDAWMAQVWQRYQSGQVDAGSVAEQSMHARHGITVSQLVDVLTHATTGLTATKRRFSHLDAIAAVADALPHGASISEVEQLTDVALAHPRFVPLPAKDSLAAAQALGQSAPLAGSHTMTGGRLYTTADVTAAERAILAAAKASTPGQGLAVVGPDVLAMAIDVTESAQGFPLSAEQRAVLTAVVSTGRAVETVEGPPGTGKTTLMRSARVAWEAAGHTVAGAATAAVAAHNLAAESGIESRTVAQWMHRIRDGHGLAGVDVLVLDEANLTSDRDRVALYRAAATAGTKIVEVGDPKQLRGVGCGSMFGYLHAVLEGPALTENRRQTLEDERAALSLFRSGNYLQAFTRWDTAGGVIAHETAQQTLAELTATWLRLAHGAPDAHTRIAGLVAIAGTNEMVDRINRVIQAVRAQENQLGQGHEFSLAGARHVTFHVGDQVLLRINDRFAETVDGEPVLNGYRGVVTAVSPRGVDVEWRQADDTPDTPLHHTRATPDYIAQGGLELGYAITGHKGEGLNVKGTWVRQDGSVNYGDVLVWTPGMDNPGLYVALSRDFGRVRMFGPLEAFEGEREQLLYGPPADQKALTDRVIAALADQAAATADNANDRPALVDLGRAPDLLGRRAAHELDSDADSDAEPSAEQTLAAQRVAAMAAARQRWEMTPEAELSDQAVSRAIADHTRHGERLRAALRETTEKLDTWTQPVNDGDGPLVRQLNSRIDQLHRDHTILTRLHHVRDALTTAERATAIHRHDAAVARQHVDTGTRLRPRQRDALVEQARVHTEHARNRAAAAQTLRTEHTQLYHQLSNDTAALYTYHGNDPAHCDQVLRDNLTQAEHSYPHELATAQAGDETAIQRLRHHAHQLDQSITEHHTRRDALLDEQATRTQLPPAQQELETYWRAHNIHPPHAPATSHSEPADPDHNPDLHNHPDHGPHL